MFRGRVKQRRVCVIAGAPLRRALLLCCRGARNDIYIEKNEQLLAKITHNNAMRSACYSLSIFSDPSIRSFILIYTSLSAKEV